MFRFDKFLEPVVVVSHTKKNYFNWAHSDWAIKAKVWVLTFAPPPPIFYIVGPNLIHETLDRLFTRHIYWVFKLMSTRFFLYRAILNSKFWNLAAKFCRRPKSKIGFYNKVEMQFVVDSQNFMHKFWKLIDLFQF